MAWAVENPLAGCRPIVDDGTLDVDELRCCRRACFDSPLADSEVTSGRHVFHAL
jgi:hypothetical protein